MRFRWNRVQGVLRNLVLGLFPMPSPILVRGTPVYTCRRKDRNLVQSSLPWNLVQPPLPIRLKAARAHGCRRRRNRVQGLLRNLVQGLLLMPSPKLVQGTLEYKCRRICCRKLVQVRLRKRVPWTRENWLRGTDDPVRLRNRVQGVGDLGPQTTLSRNLVLGEMLHYWSLKRIVPYDRDVHPRYNPQNRVQTLVRKVESRAGESTHEECGPPEPSWP